MTAYGIKLDITPVPKGRPRFSRTGHAYTDPKTREYEKAVAAEWVKQWGADLNIEGDVLATIIVGTANMRADIDNFVKSLLDGVQLAGAFATGDEQVTGLRAMKVKTDKAGAYAFVLLEKKEITE